MKQFVCPECFSLFVVQIKNKYPYQYQGKFFDKCSCMKKYKARANKMKLLRLCNEEK